MRLAEILRRVREHHAVEHATVTILARSVSNARIMGRSDWGGFYIIGEVPTDLVRAATWQALKRLQAGEAWLAVHPRCGTNLAVGIVLMSLFSMVAPPTGRRGRPGRLLRAVFAVGATLLAARPLGMLAQQWFTTTGDLSGVRGVGNIHSQRIAKAFVHRVTLAR